MVYSYSFILHVFISHHFHGPALGTCLFFFICISSNVLSQLVLIMFRLCLSLVGGGVEFTNRFFSVSCLIALLSACYAFGQSLSNLAAFLGKTPSVDVDVRLPSQCERPVFTVYVTSGLTKITKFYLHIHTNLPYSRSRSLSTFGWKLSGKKTIENAASDSFGPNFSRMV